jgi:hypothetical protein
MPLYLSIHPILANRTLGSSFVFGMAKSPCGQRVVGSFLLHDVSTGNLHRNAELGCWRRQKTSVV